MGLRVRSVFGPALLGLALAVGPGCGRKEPGALGVVLNDAAPGTVVASGVLPGGPAAAAGVRPGDLVLRIGGKPVGSAQEASRLLLSHGAGDRVRLALLRPDATGRRIPLEVDAVFAPRPPGYGTQAQAQAQAGSPPAGQGASPSAPGSLRPAMEVRQGTFFRWAMPVGWRASESISGVEVSSPDGRLVAASTFLMRTRGASRPQAFALTMLGRLPGYGGVRLLGVGSRGQKPSGYRGLPWTVEELEVGYMVKGVPSRATWTCGIVNLPSGTHDAFLLGYHAPEGQFEQARLWLWQIAQSVTITNLRQVAGNDQLLVPKNNPLDNSGLIASWRQKGLSDARISQARREGTMGYERMRDPSSGKVWDMPFERYDPGAGGYRNPNRPGELLQKARPGE